MLQSQAIAVDTSRLAAALLDSLVDARVRERLAAESLKVLERNLAMADRANEMMVGSWTWLGGVIAFVGVVVGLAAIGGAVMLYLQTSDAKRSLELALSGHRHEIQRIEAETKGRLDTFLQDTKGEQERLLADAAATTDSQQQEALRAMASAIEQARAYAVAGASGSVRLPTDPSDSAFDNKLKATGRTTHSMSSKWSVFWQPVINVPDLGRLVFSRDDFADVRVSRPLTLEGANRLDAEGLRRVFKMESRPNPHLTLGAKLRQDTERSSSPAHKVPSAD